MYLMDSMGFLLVIFLITRNSEKSWELGGSGELGILGGSDSINSITTNQLKPTEYRGILCRVDSDGVPPRLEIRRGILPVFAV